jgi:hypothetical protein
MFNYAASNLANYPATFDRLVSQLKLTLKENEHE